MATLKNIADDCGVSTATVSLALNPYRTVASKTRARVLGSAQRLGYRPNAAAQMLRSGNTNNIVLSYVKPRASQPIASPQVTHELAELLGERGYKLEVKSAPSNSALLKLLHDLVRARAADAFILWGNESDVELQGALLESLGQPFIARGYYDETHPGWTQVDFDHRRIMVQNVEKLVELGHSRIALVSHDNSNRYAVNFRQAFHDVIAARLQTTTPPEWLWLFDETLDSGEGLVVQIQHCFDLPIERRPTAIAFGESGSIVPGIDAILLSRGLRIGDAPGQFAVAGVTGFPAIKFITGPSWVYGSDSESQMISQMIDGQLMPMLRRAQPEQLILRYLPELRRVKPNPDIWDPGNIMVRADRTNADV